MQFGNTLHKKEYILSLGFNYVEMWENDFLCALNIKCHP